MAKWKNKKRRNVELIETRKEQDKRQRMHLTKFLKRELILTVISILAVTTAIIGGSYAIFSSIQKAENYNVMKTGTLQIVYDDTSGGLGNIINLNGVYPESDAEGSKREPYKFKITNTGSIEASYKVRILDDSDMIAEDQCINKLLNKELIRYSINGGSPVTLSTMAEEYKVITGKLEAGESRTYEIRMWIDENAGNEVLGTHYHGKIVVEGVQAEGAPYMDNNMIPVVYDEASSKWIKTDVSDEEWYDYEEGKWANAITVSSESRGGYRNAAIGSPIEMTDIETMWVWIPRYSYTIGSEDGENYYGKKGEYLEDAPTQALPGEIDVKFIKKSVKDTGSAKYKVSEGVSNWRTPDAFTFGDKELSGIWVGKFETSSTNPSDVNGGGNDTNLDAMIKPNVTSWRSIQVASIAEVGINMTKNNNRYGFNNKVMDSHAMKNSEWALVSYLSQSKYGKLGNKNYSGANKEIYQNKSDAYITGCSYGSPSNANTDYGCQHPYNENLLGTGASTTGTIYGVYDTSGGAWEYMMGDYAPGGEKYSGMSTTLHSGYTGLLQDGTRITGKSFLEEKYYDFYESSDPLTACKGASCISQALNETAGWYGDYTYMVTEQKPWSVRGGLYRSNGDAGVFYYYCADGSSYSVGSFRLVLSET